MSSALPPPPKLSVLSSPTATSTSRVDVSKNLPSSLSSRYQTPTASSSSSSSLSVGWSGTTTPLSKSSQPSSASYENYAPRTTEQRSRLSRIASLTAGPCFSVESGNEKDDVPAEERISLAAAMSCVDSLNNSLNGYSSNSLNGYSNGYSNGSIEGTLATTIQSAEKLTVIIKHSASLRLALRASMNIAEDVVRRHADLLRHSGELSAAAERLQAEEAALTRRAEEIGMPLRHYDAVDRIGALVGVLFKDGGRTVLRGLAKLQVDSHDFVKTLEEIDDAVEFFGEECGGAQLYGRPGRGGRLARPLEAAASGSAEYYRRACALQDAAVELLRVAVADRLSQTSTQIQDALRLPKVPLAADKLEASLAYTRFHGISKRSNAFIALARKRLDALGTGSVAATAYEELLTLCRNTYCGAREILLTSTVRSHMDILKARHGLVGMTRLASVFLIRLCTIETALYLDFFGDPDKRRHPRKRTKGALPTTDEQDTPEPTADGGDGDGSSSQLNKKASSSSSHPAASTLASQILSEDSTYRDAEFQQMLGGLCSALHRTIRRGLVSVLDLDILCQVVSVLREERSVANSSPTTLAAARAVSTVIQDAQERLIFCANSALHKEVVRFKPSAADLNYPGKLLGEEVKPAIVIQDDDTPASPDATKDSTPPSSDTLPSSEKSKDSSQPTTSSEPNTNDAVAAQLKIYESWFPPMRSVLRILSKIFRVVEPRVFEDIALQSVQSCTKSLKDGSVSILRKSGQIHADLFLVKHLLILREQLSPFDIQLRSVERQLDFSEAGKAVSRFLANRNRRLFSMSTENALITLLREGVSVQESSVDSKRDLDDCLRSACNDFIEHTSSLLLGPISVFVDQCKNTAGSAKGSAEALSKAPFMNATLVGRVFAKASENLDRELENASTQMNLYLENTATQNILLKPVARKMTRALEDAKRFITEVPDGENGWDASLKMDVFQVSEGFEAKIKMATSKHNTR